MTKAVSKRPSKALIHQDNDQLAGMAWGIAHPVRVQILQILCTGDCCGCGQIVDCLPLAQSTVSQHLKILCKSGLVKAEQQGNRTIYSVDRDQLERLKTLVQTFDQVCVC
ncbi:Transcriptional repressor PagR [Stieleria bergensis]|uniref:Transcriptional repressor PagR n=1 Tax=Stieleria bergensis TaxID=2528025 RepID=A0A517SUW1_9BACT|nr:MAG: hypothetical protein CBB71_14890 [Rhodopirellula sp. TMED11]QDT59898.1 Transcriptional repressor PagR [Planctomycetes bacterium SV_7m_r]